MAFVRPKARILERSTTSGSGPLTLAGAVDGSYNTFASFMANGDTTYVSVVEPGVAFWTGIATYNAGTITLTTVEETKGAFGAGTKEVMAGPLASTATFREDISGAIVTGGASTAYTVASYRVYDTLTRLNGNIIAFTPHTTNGATVTLNVDGLGAKPLRPSPGVELQSNSLIQGTPYLALYNHTDQVFYLHGLGGNLYGIPLGAGLEYWGSTTPSSAYAFPLGQAVSRLVYAPLFNMLGTTYGSGDGSTTFNLPDKTGRVGAMREVSASRLTASFFGGNSTVLGASGGAESHLLTTGEIPNHNHGVWLQDTGHPHSVPGVALLSGANNNNGGGGGTFGAVSSASGTTATTNVTGITTRDTGSGGFTPNQTGFQPPSQAGGSAHAIMQPTIIRNDIMRVL